MQEKDIVLKIRQYLQEQGCIVIKQHGSPYSQIGVSDLLICTPKGTFGAIEVKTPTSKTTVAQERFLEDVADNNGIAFVARSVDDVKVVMQEYL